MESRYDWRTSKALYQLFSAIHLTGKTTISELARNINKDLRIVSEHLGYLKEEGIILVEKKGRSKYVWLNEEWIRINFPKLLPINTLYWGYLLGFDSFKELTDALHEKEPLRDMKKFDYSVVEKISNGPASILIRDLIVENEKLKKELKKLKE